jgi:translation initiation factor 4G
MERLRQDSRRGQGGGGGGGRMAMGRGDARSFSGGGQYGMMPPPDYQRNMVGMDDLRRLGSRNARQASQGPVSFGPTSLFNSRSNSGRRTLGPGGIGKGGEESGQSSRTATPPAGKDKKDDKETVTSANAYRYV